MDSRGESGVHGGRMGEGVFPVSHLGRLLIHRATNHLRRHRLWRTAGHTHAKVRSMIHTWGAHGILKFTHTTSKCMCQYTIERAVVMYPISTHNRSGEHNTFHRAPLYCKFVVALVPLLKGGVSATKGHTRDCSGRRSRGRSAEQCGQWQWWNTKFQKPAGTTLCGPSLFIP